MEHRGFHHHKTKADSMLKKVLMLSLIFAFGSIKAQEKFNFKNGRNFSNHYEPLIKLLPKQILDHPEFQLRLWYGVEPSRRFDYGYGLLLIAYKNGKWKANKILITELTRVEKKRIITTKKVYSLPLKPFDIQYQFNALKADGLFLAQSVSEEQLYKLLKQRGYDMYKGYPSVVDGFGFSVELVTGKAKRSFCGRYPEYFYNKTDKLVPELIPLIKIQKRLFNIADVSLGL